jgi:tetraacyldisaccharide 4'-kinase
VEAADRERIWERVGRYAPHAIRIEVAHRPRHLAAADGTEMPLADLAGRPVAAFCGIGNPDGFRRTLLDCGCQLSGWRELPDHFPYERPDVETLAAWVDSIEDCQAVVCTRKDLVKLRAAKLGQRSLWALAIEMEVISGLEAFEGRLAKLADRAAAVEDEVE